jgi:UDP-glucose 6-dehydrogenase
MRVSVIRTGYVDRVTVAFLAEVGHAVTGMDDEI